MKQIIKMLYKSINNFKEKEQKLNDKGWNFIDDRH